MTRSTTKYLKDSPNADALASKHGKLKNRKTKRGGNTTFSSPSSNKLTGRALAQTVVVVSPPGKTPNELIPLLTDVVDLTSDDPCKLSNEDEVDVSTNANSLKPKEGITNDDDGASNGASNKADDSSKDADMGVVGLEDVPASTTQPVSNKGGVGSTGNVKMIQDKEENRLTTTLSTTTMPATPVPLSKQY